MDRIRKAERNFISKMAKKTNYNKVIEMPPDKLAEFIASIIDCCNCRHPRNGCTDSEESCAASWLMWLNETAK